MLKSSVRAQCERVCCRRSVNGQSFLIQYEGPLTSNGDLFPLFNGVHARERLERDVLAQHAGEVDAGSLDKESCGGNHGSTSVLELGSLEPSESLVTSDLGKAKGIKVLEWCSTSGQAVETGMSDSVGDLRRKGGGKSR